MKMSDALRAGADSAPVDDVHIATGVAVSRVRRNRRVRAGANGIAGVGAAALVFAGVVGAMGGGTGLVAADLADENRHGAPEPAVDGMTGGTSEIAQGGCGFGLDFSAFPQGPVDSAIAVTSVEELVATADLSFSTAAEGEYTLDSSTHYLVWNDIIVGLVGSFSDGAQVTVTSAAPVTNPVTIDLVNCWDGAALPAGDYSLVTMSSLLSGELPAAPEPNREPAPEPGDEGPDASVSNEPEVATEDAAIDITDLISYSITDAVSFTIAGDAVENPFDQYLKPVEPVDPAPLPEVPSDALAPDEARAAYEAGVALAPWNMAQGTQRVVLTADGAQPDLKWEDTYYGCPSDGTSGSFPRQSADLTWLDIDADTPSSISVSYGWVVDGNPQISMNVTNATQWSLPGFYYGGSPTLYLAKNGKVVAEAYPVNLDRDGNYGIAFSSEASARDSVGGGEAADLIWAPENEYLAPGESRGGEYLWRDVNGCWTSSGQSDVAAGQYTLLTAHSIYVGAQYALMEDAGAAAGKTDAGGGTDGTDAAVAPIDDPAIQPEMSDYVSFQVWTSLGTVTVTK